VDHLASLSKTEREVLDYIAQGYTVNEISRARFVSVATVRGQVKSILKKLHVTSQLKAVAVYHQTYRKP
jgi:DNA-binding NarL/FixJ family response regulator